MFVDGPDLDQWREALSEPTAAVFFETPSNPMQELVDIRAVVELAHAAGAQVVVDNVFGTPVFSKPLEQGADVVVYSATKHIDGQGRTLGGAVLGTKEFIDGPVRNLMRHTGPAMSPFNAWVLLKGLETLSLRVRAAGGGRAGAGPRARGAAPTGLAGGATRGWSRTRSTSWPSARCTAEAPSSPSRSRAARTRRSRLMNALQVIDISNNLGDAKSLITHPATTTHRRLSEEARLAVGITDGVAAGLGRAGGRARPGRGPPARAGLTALRPDARVRPPSGPAAADGRLRGASQVSAATAAPIDAAAQSAPCQAKVTTEIRHAALAAPLAPQQRRQRGPERHQRARS